MSECEGNCSGDLCLALILVVADLAFIELAEESRAEQTALGADYAQMKLAILEPFVGELVLAVEPGLLREITCNAYGSGADELDPANELDMLAELLNTIGGRLMQIVVPPTIGYELGLPVLLEGDGILADSPMGISFVFNSMEGRLILSVSGQQLIDEVIK